jgi:hypothetical protein
MNRENAIKLIPIIQAFANGKIIEYNDLNGNWVSNKELGFNDDFNRYRIKSEPKLVPFTFEDNLLFRDKWVYFSKDCIYRIIFYSKTGICISGLEKQYYTYKESFDKLIFEDGTVFGKLVND